MYLKSLALKNYRGYESLNVEFDPEYSVLVGINGSGKSSILDAAATALGSYISGFDGIPSNGITKDDAHRKMYELGSRIESEEQYPVEIHAVCDIDGRELRWSRSLHGKEGRTHIRAAKEIMEYSSELQQKVRDGDREAVLPLIAYYGTGRLYMQKKQKRSAADDIRFTRTGGYTDCLDSASNDKLMMRWFEQMTAIQLQENKRVPELEVVKQAMGKCFSGAVHPDRIAMFEYMMKSKEIEITYDSENGRQKLPMKMLSDGLKITISMVADIAYRMAVLNPQLLDHILEETPGIVLIDEVDMHLHPEWQRRIMEDLHYIFPKIQFIVTTHSPSVLANVKREHIILLEKNQVYVPDNTTYGRDITAILHEVMKVEIRPQQVIDLKDRFYKSLSDEQYEQAKKLLKELEDVLGNNDADVLQAKVSLDLELL
jgi:predicted ATP-binding protein involved in virulence